MMNGNLKVSSELGQGSSFQFSIPFQIPKQTEPKEEKPYANDLALLYGKLPVLVVDDNEINRHVLVEMINTLQLLQDFNMLATILELGNTLQHKVIREVKLVKVVPFQASMLDVLVSRTLSVTFCF